MMTLKKLIKILDNGGYLIRYEHSEAILLVENGQLKNINQDLVNQVIRHGYVEEQHWREGWSNIQSSGKTRWIR